MELHDRINIASESEIADYFELLKPKVMRLVLFTAAVGLFVAPISVNPVIAFATLFCVAVGAGGAGALNMWWDADIDSTMKRTANRPIPAGRVTSDQTLALGLCLSFFSVGFLGLFANWVAAALLAFTILFYILIYTIWLKRITPQNIVIGGAAGAFPPMIGWSIATGSVSIESFLMFLLIFIWTPPHFWTLALFINQDFVKARVPMLTVTHGSKATRRQIIFYTTLLVFFSTIISFSAIGGLVYFTTSVVLNTMFVFGACKVAWRSEHNSKDDNFSEEKKLFIFSIFYLFIHFAVIFIEGVLDLSAYLNFNWPVLI